MPRARPDRGARTPPVPLRALFEQQVPGTRIMRGQIGGRDDRSGQNISDSDRKARLDSAAAIKARVREMVLVTKASGSPASRNRRSAATALSSRFHDTIRMGRRD